MSAPATDAAWLKGKQVAFTGRLASMTRAEAAKLIANHGGVFVTVVSRHTAFLVVGQEGLPLNSDGTLSNKLQKARELEGKSAIHILSEEEFFERLGVTDSSAGVHRLFSTAQLCRLLRVPRDRLRSWINAGLIEPADTSQGVGLFDFQQVTGVKMLSDLAQSGVTSQQIRRSLEQLGRWLGDVDGPLSRLTRIEHDGPLLVRLDEGQLAEPSGQMHFDFSDSPAAVVAHPPSEPTADADDWWERGCDQEEAGRLHDAAASYRQALLAGGPKAEICFNLGNVLYALGQKAQASERFRQAVELDASFTEAWNNLGTVLLELSQFDEALAAYREAVKRRPDYADAHYNLADALEQLGAVAEARQHWKAYVHLEPTGQWANYARRRLAQGAKSG